MTHDPGQPLAVPHHPRGGSGLLGNGRDHHRQGARADRGVHTHPFGNPLDSQLVHPVHMDLPDLRLDRVLTGHRRDEDVRLPDVQHRLDVQLRAGEQPVPDRQHPRAALVDDSHQPPVRRPRGHAGEEIQPHRVLVHMDGPGRTGLRVHRQIPLTALVTGLHQQQRGARGRPVHLGQVRERGPVPRHFGTGSRQVHDVEPHFGVGRSRRRVGDLGRLALGVRRIGDVPALYGALVGPCHQQPVRLRRPPESPVPVHLLGRDELGQTIGDPRVLRLGQRPVALPVRADDPQRAAGHVRDVPAVGGRAGVDHRARHRQRPRGPGPQFGHVHLSGQGEGGQLGRRVHRVGDDPRRTLAGPLPPGPLLRRELLGRTAQQGFGIGGDPLLAGRRVEHPEPVGPVRPGGGPQEDHPRLIR
ncbi:hypothetical protein QFZ71_004073 [Streptomyces sp. V2I9]|nr:hypothetical protein [Streptomyces sp. V2I9]